MKSQSYFLLLLTTIIFHGTQVSNSAESDPPPSAPPRDEPVQLVRPDFEHQRLQLLEENVDLLNHVEGAVAVVAVVGPFHSGKSFLMNQLMGKSRGFGIGKYVDPQTMGIWMWGLPLEAETGGGERVSIVFLDTEGFAARNVSELYDAKVFAVASLLSSFLLYNSVKIINQDDLEYLELLARRTRLFALQAQINKAAYQQSFDHELLSFPPLIWVVQDFVQAPKAGESPTDWLRKLVASSMKENQQFDLSLSEIFADLHCHTLFLPTAEKRLLQDLSLANESDLTPDFKQERDQLKQRITESIRPKMKNGSPIRGPELATLLRVLVSASNDGSLPEVPGRWRAFLEQMKDTSKESCLRYYATQLQGFKNASGNRPLNTSLLLAWHERTLARAEALFRELMLGYSELVAVPLRDLKEKLGAKFSQERETNLKRIRSRCVEERQQQTISAEGMFASLELPQRVEELREYIEFVKRECYKDFWAATSYLSDVPDVKAVSLELLAAVDEVAVGFVRENKKKIGELYASAVRVGVSAFRDSTVFKTKDPLTPSELTRVAETALAEARKTAESQVDASLDKGSYSEFLSQLSAGLEQAREKLSAENEKLLAFQCQEAVSALKLEFISRTGPDRIPLPVFREELLSRLGLEEARQLREYKDRFSLFPGSATTAEFREKLVAELKGLAAQREQENLDALTREVSIPLGNAVSIVKLSAAKYDNVYEFRGFVLEVCEIELGKGKAKEWSQEVRKSVIENYVSQDQYIQQTINSKSGVYSALKGFVMRFLNLIMSLFF